MKVAIYARVSTDRQEMEQQILACRRFCEYRQLEVGEIFSETISGTKLSRPEYARMVQSLRSYQYDGVVVFRIDRLGRNSRELFLLFDELQAKGIEVFSINEQLDTTTPIGKFARDLLCLLAELERSQLSEATKHRLAALKNMGKKLGRPRIEIPEDQIADWKERHEIHGDSIRNIAATTGYSKSTVERALS